MCYIFGVSTYDDTSPPYPYTLDTSKTSMNGWEWSLNGCEVCSFLPGGKERRMPAHEVCLLVLYLTPSYHWTAYTHFSHLPCIFAIHAHSDILLSCYMPLCIALQDMVVPLNLFIELDTTCTYCWMKEWWQTLSAEKFMGSKMGLVWQLGKCPQLCHRQNPCLPALRKISTTIFQ